MRKDTVRCSAFVMLHAQQQGFNSWCISTIVRHEKISINGISSNVLVPPSVCPPRYAEHLKPPLKRAVAVTDTSSGLYDIPAEGSRARQAKTMLPDRVALERMSDDWAFIAIKIHDHVPVRKTVGVIGIRWVVPANPLGRSSSPVAAPRRLIEFRYPVVIVVIAACCVSPRNCPGRRRRLYGKSSLKVSLHPTFCAVHSAMELRLDVLGVGISPVVKYIVGIWHGHNPWDCCLVCSDGSRGQCCWPHQNNDFVDHGYQRDEEGYRGCFRRHKHGKSLKTRGSTCIFKVSSISYANTPWRVNERASLLAAELSTRRKVYTQNLHQGPATAPKI